MEWGPRTVGEPGVLVAWGPVCEARVEGQTAHTPGDSWRHTTCSLHVHLLLRAAHKIQQPEHL